jgi:Ribosomal RNA-processing protein 7 (RRP7) C-terminal domain
MVKVVYADSRLLEAKVLSFFESYAVLKDSKIVEPDSDGFMPVTNGFKSDKQNSTETELTLVDFYRFQHKERKLRDWELEKSISEDSSKIVADLKKRKRFEL